jgi:hypothetical protein
MKEEADANERYRQEIEKQRHQEELEEERQRREAEADWDDEDLPGGHGPPM